MIVKDVKKMSSLRGLHAYLPGSYYNNFSPSGFAAALK